MRHELAKREGWRGRFTATFQRSEQHTRGGHPVTRLLFLEVKDEHGAVVTDHLWFTESQCWRELALQFGDEVRFEARVATYMKGYQERRLDYKLNHPTQIIVLNRRPETADVAQTELQFPDEEFAAKSPRVRSA